MLTFLSDEWIDALDAAGTDGASGPLADSEASPVLTIEQRISGDDIDEVTYTVLLYEGGLRVRKGPTATPDVTFLIDRDTAAGIAQGQVSAQAAFMSGSLRLVGESSALLRSQAALTDLADRFAAVRAQTRW